MTTIGLSMIVRNGAATMRAALDPLVGVVDDIAIVLGGVSDDATAAIAREYTDKVASFTAHVDAEGKLTDFAAARQLATDMLDTEWCFHVDADDLWLGAEYVRPSVEKAEETHCDAVVVIYGDSTQFQQARIYRRSSGKWESPIHEFWQAHDGQPLRALINKLTRVSQQPRGDDDHFDRIRQNISLERHAIAVGYDTARIYEHLAQDCIIIKDYDGAVDAAREALTRIGSDNPEQRAHVLHLLGMGLLYSERYDDAAAAAIQGMATRDYGIFSAILCSSVMRLGAPRDLVQFLGERARNIPQEVRSYGYASYEIGNFSQ